MFLKLRIGDDRFDCSRVLSQITAAALLASSTTVSLGARTQRQQQQHYYEDDATTTTTTEAAGPPNPYIFSYTAGRYPGHADRTHTEVSNGQGVVKGSYSYVDPNQEIRTVDYVADEHGFRPTLSHEPQPQRQSAAVRLATERHAALYNSIAQAHANPPSPDVQVKSVPEC